MATSTSTTTTAGATASNATGSPKKEISILFVCLGNICRSPMAHAVFCRHIETYSSGSFVITHVDSAGTGAYHARAPPDSRTLRVLEKHGIREFTHAARRVRVPADFDQFDLLVGMDGDNVEDLIDMQRDCRGVGGGRGGAGSGRTTRSQKKGKGKGGSARTGADSNAREGEEEEEEEGAKKGRVVLFGAFGGKHQAKRGDDDDDCTRGEEVIDPYYGGQRGFDIAYEQMERFTKGLLKWLEDQYAPSASSSSSL